MWQLGKRFRRHTSQRHGSIVLTTQSEWIVDADLKDFFGSVDHEKLLTLVAQRVADGRVLRLIRKLPAKASRWGGQRTPHACVCRVLLGLYFDDGGGYDGSGRTGWLPSRGTHHRG